MGQKALILYILHVLYTDFKCSYITSVITVLFVPCRLALAALHYNENSNRPQATTTEGKLQYKLQFPRYAKGECRAKPVKVVPTFSKF